MEIDELSSCGEASSGRQYGITGKDIVFCLFFGVVIWRYLLGFDGLTDIALYDESVYLRQGCELFVKGLPSAELGPLYAAWYKLLSVFSPDRVALFFLNFRLLVILVPVALYVMLRCYGVRFLPSAIASFFFLISFANLCASPRVSHFCALVVIATFILASRVQSRIRYTCVVCFGLLLASYARPEMFVSFCIMFLLCVGLMVKCKKADGIDRVVFLGLVFVSFVVVNVVGCSLGSGERSFVAFGQHFSLNLTRWEGKTHVPWTDWRSIVAANFGDASSAGEAFVNNPSLFIRHCLGNAVLVPWNLVRMFFLHSQIILPVRTGSTEAFLFVPVCALAFGLAAFRQRYCLKAIVCERFFFLISVVIIVIAPLVSVIAVYPRYHYMLLPGLVLIVALMVVLYGENERLSWRKVLLCGLFMVLVVPHCSALIDLTGRQPNIAIISKIRNLNIKQTVNLLEAEGGYDIYLGDNFRRVIEFRKNVGFDEYMREKEINMVIVSDRLSRDIRFKDDEEWKKFVGDCNAHGFEKYETGFDALILVKRELLQRKE